MFSLQVPQMRFIIGQVWVKSPKPAPHPLLSLFSWAWPWTHEWSSGFSLQRAEAPCLATLVSLCHWRHFTLNYSDSMVQNALYHHLKNRLQGYFEAKWPRTNQCQSYYSQSSKCSHSSRCGCAVVLCCASNACPWRPVKLTYFPVPLATFFSVKGSNCTPFLIQFAVNIYVILLLAFLFLECLFFN